MLNHAETSGDALTDVAASVHGCMRSDLRYQAGNAGRRLQEGRFLGHHSDQLFM